jgi:hypothetical protein
LSAKALAAKQMKHAVLLQPLHAEITGDQVLGHSRAVVIVCAAANTSPLNLPRTLAELGLNGTSFQTAVFNGVTNTGFRIRIDDISDAPSTTLIAAVNAIENAPKA